MVAGQLRHPVTLQSPVRTSDVNGAVAISWLDVGPDRASIEPITGDERFSSEMISATATHRIRMRYRSDIAEDNRIYFEDRAFNVETIVNVDERNRELILFCREVK